MTVEVSGGLVQAVQNRSSDQEWESFEALTPDLKAKINLPWPVNYATRIQRSYCDH